MEPLRKIYKNYYFHLHPCQLFRFHTIYKFHFHKSHLAKHKYLPSLFLHIGTETTLLRGRGPGLPRAHDQEGEPHHHRHGRNNAFAYIIIIINDSMVDILSLGIISRLVKILTPGFKDPRSSRDTWKLYRS